MNLPFISSSEAKNAYFMSDEASRDEINGIFIQKKLNFPSIIYNFKGDRSFALNDVIHVRTLRHINDDVA